MSPTDWRGSTGCSVPILIRRSWRRRSSHRCRWRTRSRSGRRNFLVRSFRPSQMTAREVGMVQESRKARSESAAEKPIADDVMAFGGQRIEALMDIQKELLDTFEQINRERLARAQQETKLASEF